MISAVILSWKRVDGVKRICAQLRDHPLVDEIIVWNNNPEVQLVIDGVKTINSSVDFGLFTRFAAASLAKNECILYHDDDILASDSVLEQLYEHWRGDPHVCHALFGRCSGPGGDYKGDLVYGRAEIVLTRYAMVHRRVCMHVLSRTPEFADIPGEPVGNGEDIILSHAAMELAGRINRTYELPTMELGQDDAVSIYRRSATHVEHRGKIIRRCREVFRVGRLLTKERRRRQLRRFGYRLRERMGAARRWLFSGTVAKS